MYIQAVLFDFDGVLSDALSHHYHWYRYVCEKAGKECPIKTREELVDKEDAAHFATMYQHLGFSWGKDKENLQIWREEFLNAHPFEPMDGMVEVIKRLKDNGVKVGIASNNRKERVLAVLETNNLTHLFDVISCREESRQPRKAPPNPIPPALQALGVEAKRTLFVGDLPGDAKVARQAGCKVALVPWGFSSETKLMAKRPDILAKTPGLLLQKVLSW